MLTPAQYQTLKTAMLADANLTTLIAQGNHTAIAAYMNSAAVPDYWVWKTNMSLAEVYDAMLWPSFIARSQGERDCFAALMVTQSVDPSKPNVRQAFNDIFSGSANNAPTQRAQLLAASRRLANKTEKLFVLSGTGTTGDPGLMGFEGFIDAADVATALQS